MLLDGLQFPITGYRVKTWRRVEETRLPQEEFDCPHCGKKCGHKSMWVEKKKTEVESEILEEYKIIGVGADIYFYEYDDSSYDYDGTGMDTIPIEGTYLNKDLANAEIDRREIAKEEEQAPHDEEES